MPDADHRAPGRPLVTDDAGRAAAVLRAGGLVAFPTETVYGLGASIAHADAVARVFEVKGRPVGHPLIVHLASADQLGSVADSPGDMARELAAAFWPGPLTLVVRRTAAVPEVVTGGLDTVGVRVPDHRLALDLLTGVGVGVAAPSANRFGRVSPTCAADVVADLGDLVEVVLDGGRCRVGVESTIVDVTGDSPVVLRPGGVSVDQLAAVLGHAVDCWDGEGPARAPGMLRAHYSPDARVVPVDSVDHARRAVAELAASGLRRIGLLAGEPVVVDADGADLVALGSEADADAASGPDGPGGPAGDVRMASQLYAELRRADQLGLDAVVVVLPPTAGLGAAVRDRVLRAAAGSGPSGRGRP